MDSNEKKDVAFRIYNFRGTKWIQSPLLFGQNERALEIIEGLNIDTEKGILGSLRELVGKPAIPEIVAMVLKPYEPNLWAKLKNRIAMFRLGISAKNPISMLNNHEAQEVLRDFFYFNVSMLLNSSGIGELLASVNQMQTK